MQPRLTVTILVLQSEGLVSSSKYVDFALQFAPAVIIPEPNQVAVVVVAYSSLPLKVTEVRPCTAVGRGDLVEVIWKAETEQKLTSEFEGLCGATAY